MKATPRAYEGPAVYRGRATATSFHSHGNFENVSVEKKEYCTEKDESAPRSGYTVTTGLV
jgi:hypothetical protein